MAKTVITIGFDLASDDTYYEGFESKMSLLDWDIVLFKPNAGFLYSAFGDQYKGKPSLDDRSSFRLKECCEHWRREIKQAVDTGKTVIVFLAAPQEVYIDTGDRSYSGTGRNQKTTRLLAPYTTYNCLPADLKPVTAKGTAIKLSARGAEVLAPYWSEFQDCSEYQVILTAENIPACLVTRNGDKAVGAIYKSKNSSGALLLLPNIDFYPEGFVQEESEEDENEEGEDAWTPQAVQFAGRMLNAVVSLDSALHSSEDVTPEPSWASNPVYALASERSLQAELLEAESQVEEAQKRKEELLDKLKSAGRLRGLLFEKGKPLENAIIEALQILGFKATSYKDAFSEFDVVFESAEGRLIGEAEGKDNKAVNVDKLRQLAMNINEDLQREEVTAPAKGVLFGNGYRLQPPGARATAFTEKCVSAAKISSTSLVATVDLFKMAHYLSDSPDVELAKKCREAMLAGVGVAIFPEPLILESLNIQEEAKGADPLNS